MAIGFSGDKFMSEFRAYQHHRHGIATDFCRVEGELEPGQAARHLSHMTIDPSIGHRVTTDKRFGESGCVA